MTNKIHAYTEGQKVPITMEQDYSIRYLNLPITKNNELSLDFTGIIVNDYHPLVVFPKHFPMDSEKLLMDSQLLIQVIRRAQNQLGFGGDRNENNFPLDSYLFICEYYRKFGLYREQERIIRPGYNGKINWKHTIAKSEKVLNKGNLIFMPFMLDKKIEQTVLITKCMEEVLSHGYKSFARFFNIGIKYSVGRAHFNRYQIVQLIKQLKLLKTKHFKDITLKLIAALINYFEWASSVGSKIHLVTTNFEIVWEEMVHHYLNTRFKGIDTSRQPHSLIFDSIDNKSYSFVQKYTARLNQSNPIGRKYSMEYDHIAFHKERNEVILMDSKYYEKISGLNYKQFVYTKLILDEINNQSLSLNENVKVILISGLILPTENDYFSKTHINRKHIDDIVITEHYINIYEVMKNYVR